MASDEYKEIEAGLEKYKNQISMIILQPTMIFGDLCDHNVRKFIKMVDKFPVMPVVGKGENLIQPVNARDLAQAYYSVLTAEVSAGHYVLSGEIPIAMNDFYEKISEFLGKKYHSVHIPLSLALICARAAKMCTFGKIDYVERVLRMSEDRAFSHDKAKEIFNYCPEPFLVGLKREVEQYRARYE